MPLIFKCNWLKFYRKHVKKIIFVGICLGFALIVLKTDELFSKNKNFKVFFYSKPFNSLNDTVNSKKNILWMEQMTHRMEKRRKKLQENCELLGLNVRGEDALHQPNVWEFLVNRPFHLVWCNIFKAASTSWMYNFNILAGYTPAFLNQAKDVPLELARKKYSRPSLEVLEAALNDSLSFLIVRHPFERILSGFRDKIENARPNSLHQKVGNVIVEKYGAKEHTKKIWKIFNFKYFNKKRRPTFSEFVSYVINEYRLVRVIDMHWAPITNFCTPCQVRFDIIMKFETLEDDQNYLIKKKNLQDKIQPQWKNSSKGKRTSSLIDKYYSQLNSSQIYELYKLYKYDFQLFGYKLYDYLKYLNLNETMMNELKASL